MFDEKDLLQIESHGLTVGEIKKQLEIFRRGIRYPDIVAPATPEKGIKCFSEEEIDKYVSIYEKNLSQLKVVKFVPASGAASRMFKNLQSFRNKNLDIAGQKTELENDNSFDSVANFIKNIKKFAFYKELQEHAMKSGFSIDNLLAEGNINTIIDLLLENHGLGYNGKPKALIKFHDYGDFQRTALGEHLAEAAWYAVSGDGKCRLHFTVSEEHREIIEQLVARVKSYYKNYYQREFLVTFSVQDKSTDTIAVDENNNPFRNADGSLLFRPGGHGALIKNLNKIKADLIFVKNIDNVVPDKLKPSTIRYKKLLAGYLLYLQEKIFNFLDILDCGDLTESFLRKVKKFMENEFSVTFPENYPLFDLVEKAEFLFMKLNRPLRVCGMVKNVGEPGGGPFFVRNSEDDMVELQILESSQFNMEKAKHRQIFQDSTHFNPVDLVLGVYDFRGNKFNLLNYIDEEASFISVKSKDGKELKALEHPGLWNGAMSDWNTVFVEVPLNTFNPVKVVNDLLREQHQ